MVKRKRAAILPTNIILLQNLVRRDPASYHEEFLQQYSHYESLRDIYLMNPSAQDGEEFAELIGFMSAVCSCYPKDTAKFPDELRAILINNHRDLSPDLREKIIQCLVMLRNKGVIDAESLIKTIFPLLSAYDTAEAGSGQHVKALRKQVYSTLVTLLKSVNTGTKNQKLNRSTQALLFNLLEQRDANGLWATKLTRELWRRGIWDDSRTVELMTQATLHPDAKVCISGVKFFLGADKEREENFEENSSDDEDQAEQLRHKMLLNKKSSKRGKKLENAVKTMKKKNNAKHSATYLNFSAIHLLRDPQTFAEQLYNQNLMGKSSNKFDLDQKILLMNLISRLIGTHKLTVLGIYSFFLKYLNPKQRNVTQIMAAAAQSSHDLVPPESITMVVRKVADEFVSEGVASEVAAAGINTIREILARAPLAIDAPLLQDLTEYRSSKAKPVMMAARSLISLYREVAPDMLQRKDRGKVASMEMQSGEKSGLPKFGIEGGTVTGIPGLELLAKWKLEQLANGANPDENDDAEWDVEAKDSADESDVEGDWIKVDSDKEYNVSDSEDEAEPEDVNKENDSDLDLSSDEEADDAAEGVESDIPKPIKKLSKKAKLDVEKAKTKAEQEKAMTDLLSSRILTPADFAKLEELRTEAGVDKLMGKSKMTNEDEIDSINLMGASKHKMRKDERLAHVMEGREGREKFASKKGKIETPHSTTNREKARKKNFVMMIHKRQVQGKAKMSLRDKQKVLRAHIDRQKKGK